AGKGFRKLGQSGKTATVHLDRRHTRAGAQQRPGKAAGAGADLKHRPILQITRNGGDTAKQLFVEEEVLPQRPGSSQAMRGDNLAQRRKIHDAARRAAISPAMRIAAIVAFALAWRVPAMPNAVP